MATDSLSPYLPLALAKTAQAYYPAWQQLYEQAVDKPVSLCPELATALLQTLESDRSVQILRHGTPKQLTALAIVAKQNWRWGLPGTVLQSWETPLTFSGTPLIAETARVEDIAAWLRTAQAPLLLRALPCSGFFWRNLSLAAAQIQAPLQVLDTWQRAALRPVGDFETWFNSNFERKRRKEYRRMRNRLAETGILESRTWTADQPIEPWLDEFLALEAQGWKGKRGTALVEQPHMADCFKSALSAFAAKGELRFWALTLDGKTIATLFAFVAGDTAWLAKITYDENHAKYSPGVLLILDATESLFNDPAIKLVDSCAIPNHPMIDNIWRDRIAMADVLVGTPGLPLWRFKLMVQAELWRRTAREALKTVFYTLTHRHRS